MTKRPHSIAQTFIHLWLFCFMNQSLRENFHFRIRPIHKKHIRATMLHSPVGSFSIGLAGCLHDGRGRACHGISSVSLYSVVGRLEHLQREEKSGAQEGKDCHVHTGHASNKGGSCADQQKPNDGPNEGQQKNSTTRCHDIGNKRHYCSCKEREREEDASNLGSSLV